MANLSMNVNSINVNIPSKRVFCDELSSRSKVFVSFPIRTPSGTLSPTTVKHPFKPQEAQPVQKQQQQQQEVKPHHQQPYHQQQLQQQLILQKRYQIERERALIDVELRRLELEEQASRRRLGQASDTTAALPTKQQPLGKMMTPCRLSKQTWDSSTKEMSMSSSASSSSSLDDEALFKLQQQLKRNQKRQADDLQIKEIVVQYNSNNHISSTFFDGEADDNNSVTSLLTLPLTPWEELELLIQSEQTEALKNAQISLKHQEVPTSIKTRSSVPKESTKGSHEQRKPSLIHHHYPVIPHSDNRPQQQQQYHRRPPTPTRQDSFASHRIKLDQGDVHPGRVKNMPLQIEFPLQNNTMENHYYFSPQWLHSSSTVQASYTGPLRQGLPYGIAILRFGNGDMYMGEVVWGEMHGQGTYRTKRGQVWRGLFDHNAFVENENTATALSAAP
jgi:hypothetical protein